jgi:RHS repeat-associated protein
MKETRLEKGGGCGGSFGELFVSQRNSSFDSRYKFTAKELDNETNYTYFGARYYDSDISIWLSACPPKLQRRWVDPLSDKYPSLSPYMYCAGNPLFFIDPNGMDLDVPNDSESKSGLNSIVRNENRHIIQINESGNVSIDFSGLSEKEIKKTLRKDPGLAIINDLVNSDKKFLFEISDVALINSEAGNKAGLFIVNNSDLGVINASNYGKDSDDSNTHRPRDGYDGHVVIAQSGVWQDRSGKSNKRSLIFHELAENYYRTHYGYDYNGNNTNSNQGAHYRATRREGGAYMNSTPGHFTYSPAKLSNNQMNALQKKINKYYGY